MPWNEIFIAYLKLINPHHHT